jgi:hypothetical protein
MPYREIIAVFSEIHTVRTAQKTHSVSIIKTSQLMLYREIIVVCSEIHTIPYRAVNTPRLGYKNQSVNAV